jgi:hypothetical protein
VLIVLSADTEHPEQTDLGHTGMLSSMNRMTGMISEI